MANYVPGSYSLDKLDLIYEGGSLDCKDRFAELTIEESLMIPSMSCSIVLLDAADIYNKIDFDGSEKLQIKFYSHTQREIDISFQLYKDQVIADQGSGSNKLIKLFGVTPEHYTSESSDINQSFEGSISEFSKKIFSKLGTERPFEAHPTAGNVITIVPGLSIFETMNYLAQKAYSVKHKTSLFRFYETVDGYNFKNIEQIIAEEKKSPITYTYSATGNLNITGEKQQYLISSLTFDSNKDIMQKLKTGMYASETHEIDILDQKITSSPFLGKELFKEFTHLDNDAMSLDSIKVIDSTLGKINTSFWLTRSIDTSSRENNYSTIMGRRLFYQTSLEQLTATAIVPGNTDLSIGKIINLEMPEQTPQTDTKENEGKISGNYLIGSVVHQIDRDNYSCGLKLYKESYRANVPTPDKNIVDIKAPTNG